MSNTRVEVNIQVFPLSIVESALYVLSERIDGRTGEVENDQVSVTLEAVEEGLDAAGMERALNQALIAASVNDRAFQMAAPIRNYLAQTAFSITTENQQTIEEFAASMAGSRDGEHAGAPSCHLDIAASESEDDLFASTEAGNRWLLEEKSGQVVLMLNTHKYLLPDALWAANEMRDTCTCFIDNLPRNQLRVVLKPGTDDERPVALVEGFEHWLSIATECRR